MNSTKIYKYLIAAGIIIFPVAYIIIESSKSSEPELTVESNTSSNAPLGIKELEMLASSDPTTTNLIDLSVAYINNNMPEKSIDHLLLAAKMNPEKAIVYNNLCVAYTLLKQYDKGIEAGKKALQLEPDFQLAKNNLAWALDEKMKLDSNTNN